MAARDTCTPCHLRRLPALLVVVVALVFAARVMAQVPVTIGSYTQDFGMTDINAWTNNVTFPGWYQNVATFGGHVNVTASAPTNTGGFYSYECAGANDQKIGSRASSSASIVRYGVVLWNQTGSAIQSVRVSYKGYQFSLAQNGSTINSTTFDYVVSASIPAINTVATGSVAALDFQHLQSSGVAGSNQISGYPCTQVRSISGCIDLSPALAPGTYILLRWTDVNDPNNDHHMGIDDVQIDFDLTGTGCNVLLPIELLLFEARAEESGVRIQWATASERDNAFFTVERSPDGQTFSRLIDVPAVGDSQQRIDYSAFDEAPLPGISYYRLRQTDVDLASTTSWIVPVHRGSDQGPVVVPNPSENGPVAVQFPDTWVGSPYEVIDALGHVMAAGMIRSGSMLVDLSNIPPGPYFLRAGGSAIVTRIIRL